MPQAINLIIRNGATTPVDKEFTLLAPAAGNGGIAEWALKEGAVSGAFPRLTAMATPTSNKSRNAKLKLKVPSYFVNPTTGLTEIGPVMEFNTTVSVPDGYPEAFKDNAVAYHVNITNHPMVRSMIRDAISAT